jgi:Zn-finger nucleic acid-binding protein
MAHIQRILFWDLGWYNGKKVAKEECIMKCIYCGAAMPPSGLICDYCGKRNPLNLTSLKEKQLMTEQTAPKLTCSLCKTEMDQINVGIAEDILIHRCSECDGVFVTEENLQKTIKHHVGVVQVVDYRTLRFILDHPRHENDTNTAYKQCPVCHERMRKLTYAAVSGVLVDRCIEHGVWLDSGELQQLFEWKSVAVSLHKQQVAEGRAKVLHHNTKERRYTKDITHDPFEQFLTWLFGAGMV